MPLGACNTIILHCNIAVVNIQPFPGLRAARLDHHLQFESHSEVAAVGRCFKSGKLMATGGIVQTTQVEFIAKSL